MAVRPACACLCLPARPLPALTCSLLYTASRPGCSSGAAELLRLSGVPPLPPSLGLPMPLRHPSRGPLEVRVTVEVWDLERVAPPALVWSADSSAVIALLRASALVQMRRWCQQQAAAPRWQVLAGGQAARPAVRLSSGPACPPQQLICGVNG